MKDDRSRVHVDDMDAARLAEARKIIDSFASSLDAEDVQALAAVLPNCPNDATLVATLCDLFGDKVRELWFYDEFASAAPNVHDAAYAAYCGDFPEAVEFFFAMVVESKDPPDYAKMQAEIKAAFEAMVLGES